MSLCRLEQRLGEYAGSQSLMVSLAVMVITLSLQAVNPQARATSSARQAARRRRSLCHARTGAAILLQRRLRQAISPTLTRPFSMCVPCRRAPPSCGLRAAAR